MTVEENLASHNIQLPEVSAPAAAYVPYQISGKQLVISGQLPFANGALSHTGQLGKDQALEAGQACARICALNVLAHAKNACGGDLNRISKTIKLEILVSATADFDQPHIVANGASQLILDALGADKGKHARVAYGVSVLPMNAAVEVAATFELA